MKVFRFRRFYVVLATNRNPKWHWNLIKYLHNVLLRRSRLIMKKSWNAISLSSLTREIFAKWFFPGHDKKSHHSGNSLEQSLLLVAGELIGLMVIWIFYLCSDIVEVTNNSNPIPSPAQSSFESLPRPFIIPSHFTNRIPFSDRMKWFLSS